MTRTLNDVWKASPCRTKRISSPGPDVAHWPDYGPASSDGNRRACSDLREHARTRQAKSWKCSRYCSCLLPCRLRHWLVAYRALADGGRRRRAHHHRLRRSTLRPDRVAGERHGSQRIPSAGSQQSGSCETDAADLQICRDNRHPTRRPRQVGRGCPQSRRRQTYSGDFTALPDDALKLRAYIGLPNFGRSQIWTRTDSTTASGTDYGSRSDERNRPCKILFKKSRHIRRVNRTGVEARFRPPRFDDGEARECFWQACWKGRYVTAP